MWAYPKSYLNVTGGRRIQPGIVSTPHIDALFEHLTGTTGIASHGQLDDANKTGKKENPPRLSVMGWTCHPRDKAAN